MLIYTIWHMPNDLDDGVPWVASVVDDCSVDAGGFPPDYVVARDKPPDGILAREIIIDVPSSKILSSFKTPTVEGTVKK